MLNEGIIYTIIMLCSRIVKDQVIVDIFTLVLGIRFVQGNYGTDWHYLMAASLVVMLPVILAFFFAQHIVNQGGVYRGFK